MPDPEPGALDVVVRVEACALNRLDAVQRHGWYQLPGFTYPHIAGMDVAGTVVVDRRRRHRCRGRAAGRRRPVAGRRRRGLEARRPRRLLRRARRDRRQRRRRLRRALPGAGQPRLPGARRHADRARGDVPDLLPDSRPRLVRGRQARGRRDGADPRRRLRRVRRGDPARQARRRHRARHRRHRRQVRARAGDSAPTTR